MYEYEMFIGGEWRRSHNGDRMTSIEPATEQILGTVPAAQPQDVDRAVEEARAAAEGWRHLPPVERGERVRAMADRLEAHSRELAELDARDSGNPLAGMLGDVRGACAQIRMFAGLATELRGATAQNGAAQFAYSLREPYGVVARIIPSNHPLKFAAAKVAAPLVAGNALLLKPAEVTSLSALRMAELVGDLFPPGVLNVITGRGPVAGRSLVTHPEVPRIAFTGGVEAGISVLEAAAPSIKQVTLELGGKNPMIVFPDVDVEAAARAAVKGMNFEISQGQSCMSNSRVLVHDAIHDRFVDLVVDLVEALRVGDPLDDRSSMGPLVSSQHFEWVTDLIEGGIAEGADLRTGGGRIGQQGYFVEPTVFADVTNTMRIAREEVFGPVMSILRWSSVDEVVAQANDSQFGLTANVWTRDISMAHRVAHALECGHVWINGEGTRVPGTPFGGYKMSGIGQENSLEELLSYTREKVIAVSV